MQQSLLPPLRYGLNDEAGNIFSRHYFEHILPETAEYQQFDVGAFVEDLRETCEN